MTPTLEMIDLNRMHVAAADVHAGPNGAACPPASVLFRQFQRPLLDFLRRSFPGSPADWREDAVSSAFEVILLRPALVQAAWDAGGAPHVGRRLRLIAWRQLRATHRRARPLVAMPAPDLVGDASLMENGLVAVNLDASVARAARSVCSARETSLITALVDRLASGDGDAAVAARHQLRREYVGRARRALAAELGLR
jgi:hypothetical protein